MRLTYFLLAIYGAFWVTQNLSGSDSLEGISNLRLCDNLGLEIVQQ